jgi:hypothetical protein
MTLTLIMVKSPVGVEVFGRRAIVPHRAPARKRRNQSLTGAKRP